MKRKFYSEMSYVFGLIILALGTAFMEKADFGLSMIVAPAYILHLKISQTLVDFFSFGMAEYCIQLLLIILTSVIMKRFRLYYLFSFATAVIYGIVLDLVMKPVALITADGFAVRSVMFVVGMLLCAFGVTLLLHTYFAPEAYELLVKEISEKRKKSITFVKTIYDMSSLVIGVVLSFCFFGFGHFEGVNVGTLINAILNGWLIGKMCAWFDKRIELKDMLKIRKLFE